MELPERLAAVASSVSHMRDLVDDAASQVASFELVLAHLTERELRTEVASLLTILYDLRHEVEEASSLIAKEAEGA